jgi:hypothetical protein
MPQLAISAILVCWLLAGSLWIYPHSLSYFNESIGGPRNGSAHLLGSNIDWGQDLRYVKSWIDKGYFQSGKQLRLVYFGPVSPTSIGIWEFDQGEPTCKTVSSPKYTAVSYSILNPLLRGAYSEKKRRQLDKDLPVFRYSAPELLIGYSIAVFESSHENARARAIRSDRDNPLAHE